MKIKVSEATELQLDWMVAKIEGISLLDAHNNKWELCWTLLGDNSGNYYTPTTDWAQGGPILHENSISVIRCDDDYKTDRRGFTTSKRIPVWGAVIGGQHNIVKSRDSYGSPCEDVYEVNADIVSYGPTPLIAAMRCFCASKLGDEVEVPGELK